MNDGWELCLRHRMTDLLLLFPRRRFKKQRIQMIVNKVIDLPDKETPLNPYSRDESEAVNAKGA